MRPWMIDGITGDYIDLIDSCRFSTQYSHTRFLVPVLQNYKGWALYLDGDIIFTENVKELFSLCDDKYAIMCVKHKMLDNQNTLRFDGRLKRQYFRKNWSSLMLINCGHPSNKHLTKENVNLAKGSELHSFCWLDEHEIGELPRDHNHISGLSRKIDIPEGKKIAFPLSVHFTEGGPWDKTKKDVPYASLWIHEYEEWCRDADHGSINELPKTIYDR